MDELEIRFSLDGNRPDVDTVKETLGDKINSAKIENGVYIISFDADDSKDEADVLWLMFCEIGSAFPGATLVD